MNRRTRTAWGLGRTADRPRQPALRSRPLPIPLAKDGKSVEFNGKTLERLIDVALEADEKEIDLRLRQGPNTTGERHYPKTLKAKPWPPRDEGE